MRGLGGQSGEDLLVGLDNGDDGAVERVAGDVAVAVLDGGWDALRVGYVSGGLLVVGEVPGAPVIGHTVAGAPRIRLR